MKSAYVRIKIHTSYAQRVAAETETEETAKYPQEKDRMKQAMSKSTPKKGRKRIKTKDKPASATQERMKKEDSTQGEYAHVRLARSTGGV